MGRGRYRVGAVVAIPLPDGRFGYGRLYQNLNIGLFRVISDTLLDVAEVIRHPVGPVLFFADAPVRDGTWPVIGTFAFRSEKESWPPPARGSGLVYWVGVDMKVAGSEAEVAGLEYDTLRDAAEIVRRLYLANGERPRRARPAPKPKPVPPAGPRAEFAALFANDTAALVEQSFREAIDDGSTAAAVRAVFDEFAAELDDADDRQRVLLPLAVLLLDAGRKVPAAVKKPALELLAGPAVAKEYPAGSSRAKVRAALMRLRERLAES